MRKTAEQIAEEITSLSPEMRKHFHARTRNHIALTQKYCKRIEDQFPELKGLVARGKNHDESKFKAEELEPYVWLTWCYKCEDDGEPCVLPSGMKDKIDAATEHRIVTNAHHPEFHQKQRRGLLNKKDRDKPGAERVDATGMSDLDIAEMVADWCAMSEERGNTPKEWADKNVNVRWKFKPEQKTLIYSMIEKAWAKEKKMKKTAKQIAEEVITKIALGANAGSPGVGTPGATPTTAMSAVTPPSPTGATGGTPMLPTAPKMSMPTAKAPKMPKPPTMPKPSLSSKVKGLSG